MPTSFDDLPSDVLANIGSFLDDASLGRFSEVSRRTELATREDRKARAFFHELEQMAASSNERLASVGSKLRVRCSFPANVDWYWESYANTPPLILTKETGVFHTWRDCGKSAQEIIGLELMSQKAARIVDRDPLNKVVLHKPRPDYVMAEREKFIRMGLGMQHSFVANKNDRANPRVGEALLIVVPGSSAVSGYRYHWAAVILRDEARGLIYTLEAFAGVSSNEMICEPHFGKYSLDQEGEIPTFHSYFGWPNSATLVIRSAEAAKSLPVNEAEDFNLTKEQPTGGALQCANCGELLVSWSAKNKVNSRLGKVFVRKT